MGDRTRRGLFGLAMMVAVLVGFGPCDPPPPSCPPSSAAVYDGRVTQLLPVVASSLGRAGPTVTIGTGQNAQSIVNAHPPGTFYLVAAGTHASNFSVVPKAGDIFCGEAGGAVLDGGNTVAHAFSGSAANVTLQDLTVQHYNAGFQGAAIAPATHAGGWLVRNVSSNANYWAGLMATDNIQIIGGHYNDNGQLGISGNSATNILIDGVEVLGNRVLRADCQYEGGGIKWDEGSITVRNSTIKDNDCRGIWGDINTHDSLIENNIVQGNASEGIVIEISQDAIIRNNLVYGNGNAYPPGNGWYWNAGILASASFGIEVYGNHLSGNYNGVTGVQQTRNDSTPPAHLLDDFHVHDNMICATGAGGHPTGVIADNGANLAIRDITFTNNTVQVPACF